MDKKITISVKNVLALFLFLFFLSSFKNNNENSLVEKYSISADDRHLYRLNNQSGEVYYWWGSNVNGYWKKWGTH